MLNLLFVLAGIYIKYINIFIDGSFFVPYLFFICTILLKKEQHVALLVCMECCQGSSCYGENLIICRKRVQR